MSPHDFLQAFLKKKKSDSGRVRDPTAARRQPDRPGFVDKLLDIHRIECAELPCSTRTIFLSSFDPVQTQGLSDR
jgi:hypothetical protein